jgi:hypothetical protein
MTEFVCQALDFNGRMYCGRCRLDWPAAAAEANVPRCKPKADPPIGITEMWLTLTAEAKRTTDSQHACIEMKFRTEPYQPEMRKAAVMIATAQLLEQVYRDERIMQLLKERKS